MTPPAEQAPGTPERADMIGIIGGTGPAGIALATRLVLSGESVLVGSREQQRAAEAAAVVAERAGPTGVIVGGSNRQAASCALVVVAANADHAVSEISLYASDLAGSIVVSMAARFARGRRGMKPNLPPEGSIAAALAANLPASRIVAALHHLPAAALGNLAGKPMSDVLVCGDDEDAVATVIERFASVTAGRLYDIGGLENAAMLESLTAALVTVNMHSRSTYSLHLTEEL